MKSRLVAVATAGLLAVGGLTACQAQPGAALFVGDTRIPSSQIDSAMDDITAVPNNVPKSELRALMAQDLAFIELADRYAKQKGITLPPVPPGQAAALASNGFTVKDADTNAFFKSYLQARSDSAALLAAQEPVTPTDAELHATFDQLVAQGGVAAEQFSAFKAAVLSDDKAKTAFGLKRELTKLMETAPVKISPQYQLPCEKEPCQQLGFTLYQVTTQDQSTIPLVVLPLTEQTGTPVVLNLPQIGTDTQAPGTTGNAQ
jgi:hypothetical protein